MQQRESFTFYGSWWSLEGGLSHELFVELLYGIVKYSLFHEQPDFKDNVQKAFFEAIKPTLDCQWKRAKAGSLSHGGGAPKGNKNALKPDKSTTKQQQINNKTTTKQQVDIDIDVDIYNNKSKDLSIEKENNKKKRKELDLSFAVGSPIEESFKKWLAYKRERKESYTQTGAKSCFNRLVKMSGNDPTEANELVEFSMSNNWQGIYDGKSRKIRTNQSGYEPDSGAERIASNCAAVEQAFNFIKSGGGNNPQ